MKVFLGHVSIAHALGDGSVTVAGRSDLRRAFGGWIGLSQFASPRAWRGSLLGLSGQPGHSQYSSGPALVTVKTGQLTLHRARARCPL